MNQWHVYSLKVGCHRGLRDDAEQTFGPDDEPEQVVVPAVEVLAAEPDDLAVGRYELHAEHVVRREAVLQAMHPARFSATLPPIVQAIWLDGSGA